MRVHIAVTTADGKSYEGDATLVAVGENAAPKRPPTNAKTALKPDLSLPMRAFVKRHVSKLDGPRKFTALVAKLADGKTGVAVALKDIEKNWNRMKGPLGRYNPAYSTRAKESGWVDAGPKTGSYVLIADWADAMRAK